MSEELKKKFKKLVNSIELKEEKSDSDSEGYEIEYFTDDPSKIEQVDMEEYHVVEMKRKAYRISSVYKDDESNQSIGPSNSSGPSSSKTGINDAPAQLSNTCHNSEDKNPYKLFYRKIKSKNGRVEVNEYFTLKFDGEEIKSKNSENQEFGNDDSEVEILEDEDSEVEILEP